MNRRGTVLIIVAGLAALMASLALTFLARVRSDVEEGQLQLQMVQARVMLVAGAETRFSDTSTERQPSGTSQEIE